MSNKVKVAAVQLEPQIGDVQANLTACENMADEAGEKGAKWIMLPEFFTTGMAFNEQIVEAIQPAHNSPALNLLLDLAKRHNAYVGGSFIMRDKDEVVRNAFYLVSPDGVVGRHDKDIPTMWENCFYVGGSDDGIIEMDNQTVGVSLCWEFMRSQTARRLRGKVDIIVGGSCWWSIPTSFPKKLTQRWEERNEKTALESVRSFADYVGAPILHAAHVGPIECPLPGTSKTYKGHYEAGAMIVDGKGEIIALRDRHQGPGLVIGEVEIGRTTPTRNIPRKYWLHKRGPIPTIAWNTQRVHGRRWYRRNVANRNKGKQREGAPQHKEALDKA